MRMKTILGKGISLLLILASLMLIAQPLLADSVTYLYETKAVGEIDPCG